MTIYQKKNITGLIFLIFIVLIGFVPRVYSFNVNTLKINKTAQPGQEIRGQIIVNNGGKKIEQIKVTAGDWYRDDNGKGIFAPPGTVDRSFTPWLTSLTPSQFSLEPGKSKTVKYTIKIPEDIANKDGTGATVSEPAGLYYGAIFVENRPAPINKVGNIGARKVGLLAKMRYAIRLDLMIPQNIEKKGAVTKLEVQKKSDILDFSTWFKNVGNIILHPSGYIQLSDNQGNIFNKIDINSFEVLPGGNRIIRLKLSTELQPGQYSALSVIDYGGDVLVAGEKVFQIDKNGRIKGPKWD